MMLAILSAVLGLAGDARSQAAPAVTEPPARPSAPTPETYRDLAEQVEAALRRDVLEVWFPRAVDECNGGFLAAFGRDWQPGRSLGKFSVFQGRMTWIAAQVALRRPELKERYLPYVRHGIDYLSGVAWDKEQGGFYWGLQDDGRPSPYFSDGKHLYGISFCIYGLAAAHQATGDPRALDLAQRAFRWLEQHAHDRANGGYFEWLKRDGSVVQPDPGAVLVQRAPVALFPIGFKSMNTHIHLLEAFTQLYETWRDETLRARLEELLAIVRDRICVRPGVMHLYFTNDWRPIPDHDSYGHDVEAGYLMIEAAAALGHAQDPQVERLARALVDHALAYGWDAKLGGFFREGTTFGPPEDRQKEWWVEVEGLNALLLMHERYGRETPAYFEAFRRQWQFIATYQTDAEHRGLYEMVGADGVPTVPGKGRIWKAAYHDGRAFLNVSERLRALAASGR